MILWRIYDKVKTLFFCENFMGTETLQTAKTDQKGWMPRLIWVFAGCKGHIVDFPIVRLNFVAFVVQIIVKINHKTNKMTIFILNNECQLFDKCHLPRFIG